MGVLICILFFCFFTWGILRWKFFNLQGISRNFLLVVFSIKIIAALGLTYVYTYHYTDKSEADIYRYYDDSQHLHAALFENPKAYVKMLTISDDSEELMPYLSKMNNWFPAERTSLYNDNRTVIRINAFIRLFSFGNYYVHLILFIMFAFYGLTFLYKAFHRYFPGKKKILFAIIFLTPSLLFWSSGILKEAPLLLAFGIVLNLINKIFTQKTRKIHYLVLSLCFLFLFHLKFYVGLLLIPAITGYLFILWNKGPHPIIKIILNFGAYFTIAVIWHKINWNWSLFTVLKWKRRDFLGLANHENAKSLIETGNLDDNPFSFLIHAPQGFWNTLTRPYPWEIYSAIILPNAIENILILIFITLCVIYGKREQFKPIGYFFLMFSIGLMTIIGMVTPIMGSLVRYKIPALPFLLMFFLLFLDIQKLKKSFPILNKIL